mgnify:CR=1 FL=1
MKRIPKKINSETFQTSLVVSSRFDKLGNLFYLVEFHDEDDNKLSYVYFEKMSSVLDFINSNFRCMNNPFNIRFSARNLWLGQLTSENGFCSFDSIENGVRAFVKLLYHYYYRRNLRSIRSIISVYAPRTENNTENYIKFCTKQVFPDSILSCDDETLKSRSQLFKLSIAMYRFESGKIVSSLVSSTLHFYIDEFFSKLPYD